MTAIPAACERSRSYVSLRLDGELAELEGRMLDAHLVRCAPCRELARELGAITSAMRATPLAPIDGLATPRFRRPWSGRLRPAAAVAATLLVAIGAAGAVRPAPSPVTEPGPQQTQWPLPARYLSDRALIAEQRHIAIVAAGERGAPAQVLGRVFHAS